jgi:PAS domain S-box-containing protein
MTLHLSDDHVLHMAIDGAMDANEAKRIQPIMDKYIHQMQASGKPVLALADMSKMVIRRPGKEDGELRDLVRQSDFSMYDRMAVYGGNRFALNLMQYVVTATGKSHNIRFFTSRVKAEQWVRHGDRSQEATNAVGRILAATTIGTMTVSALIGWESGLAEQVITANRTMSPLPALGLLLLSVCLLLLHRGRKHPDARLLAGLLAVWTGSIALFAFVCSVLQTGSQINGLLYTVWLRFGQYPDLGTPYTAAGIIICSVLVMLATSNRPRKAQQYIFTALLTVLMAGALIACLARAYGLEDFIWLPVNTAVAMLVFGYGVQVCMSPPSFVTRLGRMLKIYWQAGALLLVVTVLGGVLWQQIQTVIDPGERLPSSATTVGLILVFLIVLSTLNQINLRFRLFQLADRINGDLEAERNRAVAVKQKDEAILASIIDAVMAVDTKGKITLFNQTMARMTGQSSDDAMGQPCEQVVRFVGEDHIMPDYRFIHHLLSKGGESELEIAMLGQDDQPILTRVTASAITVKGEVTGAIMVLRDITHEKEVDRMKTEFISLASHQLRTPLSAIKWFSELLLSGDGGKLKPDQQDFAQSIAESTERMIELVNSLLNISRMESGRIMIDPKPTDLKELVSGIINDLKAKTEERNQTLIVSVHEGLPLIKVDPRLISQVYLNLLTNAIKYSPTDGEISVFISRKDNKIISQVSDNGYGIPESQHDKVFQKFFRAENITKIETDGTGLGLYLIKSIVESSGGEIWFESVEGKGTTFWFTIPLSGMKAKKGEVTLDG